MSLMTSRLPRLLRRHPRVALAVAAALTLGWLADDWAFHKVPSVELQAWCYTAGKPGDIYFQYREGSLRPLGKPVSSEFRMVVAALLTERWYDRAVVDGEKILVTPQFAVNDDGRFAEYKGGFVVSKKAMYRLTQEAAAIIARKRQEEGIQIDYNKIGIYFDKNGIIIKYPEYNCIFTENFVSIDGEYARNPLHVKDWLYSTHRDGGLIRPPD